MLSYFRPLLEQYYFINIIPDIEIFGFPSHFYFYLFVLLGMGVFLIFTRGFFYTKEPTAEAIKRSEKHFLSIILVLWFIAILPWFITQIHWLVNDIDNFYGKSVSGRQRIAVTNVIKNYGVGEYWHDFYDFLEFGKNQVPKGSSIYIVPASPLFQRFARYYLYPDARVINTSQTADYIFSFNVDLPDDLIDFDSFKQLGLNKVILKQKQP